MFTAPFRLVIIQHSSDRRCHLLTLSYFHIDSFYPEEPHISPAPPPVFLLSSLIASVVIVVVPTVSVPLAVAGHIIAVIPVSYDPISASLAVAGHVSIAVVVPCNPVCICLAESSTHDFSSLYLKGVLFTLNILLQSSLLLFRGYISEELMQNPTPPSHLASYHQELFLLLPLLS